MRIVSLEDDEPFWDLVKEELENQFPSIELLWFHTESQFYGQITNFAAEPPDIFLLDIMVKWADAAEKVTPAPKEVQEGGYYRAGLRCRKMLLENPATAKIPVILFTVLERGDIERVVRELPANTAFVGKSGDFRELTGTIKHFVRSF